ncbi:MAG: CotH kinase family protein [Bacteroidota bacterium]
MKIERWLIVIGILLIFQLIENRVFSQSNIDHWETVVYDTSIWKYTVPNATLESAWISAGYDDSGWQEGKGGIGYGDSDDSTIISNTLAVFLRKKFQIEDISKIEGIVLHVDYDDGYIAYLNGVEVARRNLGTIQFPQYDQPSLELHESLLYQGLVPESLYIDKENLVAGENILAVQVHNVSTSSSDLTARVFLSVAMNVSTTTYGPVPDWFAYFEGFESSDLPIVVINTGGAIIEDHVRIVADMGVIDNGPGSRNYVTDPFNNYNGKIAIETRGESSQMFPKKAYGFETQTLTGENNNVSLLGMPVENDWILYAPYSDKSLIRNVLAYHLSNMMGKYASRTRFCEIVLNGEYIGIYVLMEKIKRDKSRVDIAKLKPEDIEGDQLTGGYILRIDKIDDNDYPQWTSVPVPRLSNEGLVNLQFFDPKGDELMQVQREYIKSFIFEFESALSSHDYIDFYTGYNKYIDVSHFVDYMIMYEISKNVDGYRFSTYLYKDKDSKGGKLKMGPLWDFNLAFGNVNYHDNSQYAPGWLYNDPGRVYWFRRLLSDPNFANRFQCRWNELRSDLLSNNNVNFLIDSLGTVLNESQVRNFERWPVLGNYVWPNQFIGNTYGEEITFMKTWLTDRLDWMDNYLDQPCEPTVTSINEHDNLNISVFPNPSSDTWEIVGLPLNENIDLALVDHLGRVVYETSIISNNRMILSKNKTGGIKPGVYMLIVANKDKVLKTLKLFKVK